MSWEEGELVPKMAMWLRGRLLRALGAHVKNEDVEKNDVKN